MADKDFKVKNKLVLNGLTQAGILLADANKQVDSVSYLTAIQGGTGTTTAPSAGQILYSMSGTTYAPVNLISTVFPSQTGNSGKYLTTDGSNISWGTVSSPPDTVTLTGTQTLTNKTLALGSNTISGAIADFNTALTDADFATLARSETLTNKTLTSPTVNNSIDNYPLLKSPEEFLTVTATTANGTIAYDALTQGVLYYTTNASANFTLNFRGNSGSTLSSILPVGASITLVFLNTNGATPYYPIAFQVDGNAVTPKWQGGTAPTAGNANSIDAYTVTIIKTAATPTYTVLAAQVKFA